MDKELIHKTSHAKNLPHVHPGQGWPHYHEDATLANGGNVLQTAKHVEKHHSEGGNVVSQVHVTSEVVASFEICPPHPPRVETAQYRKSHAYLIETQDKPCVVCGVRKSTLTDPAKNKFSATAMETHHYPVERSLLEACDPNKVHIQFPEVIDKETLYAFVDSTRNLTVLCDVHHRSLEQGIHHLLTQDFAILPFLYDHYQIAASAFDKDQVISHDAEVIQDINVGK